jgi:hypothetical protein
MPNFLISSKVPDLAKLAGGCDPERMTSGRLGQELAQQYYHYRIRAGVERAGAEKHLLIL